MLKKIISWRKSQKLSNIGYKLKKNVNKMSISN